MYVRILIMIRSNKPSLAKRESTHTATRLYSLELDAVQDDKESNVGTVLALGRTAECRLRSGLASKSRVKVHIFSDTTGTEWTVALRSALMLVFRLTTCKEKIWLFDFLKYLVHTQPRIRKGKQLQKCTAQRYIKQALTVSGVN